MPALFIGHGNPMNALERNAYTEAWQHIATGIPRPRLTVAISAHWYVEGTRVSADQLPGTIHDFGGFPRELYEVQYRAPGSREFARIVPGLLKPTPVLLDHQWGLDHGTWSVLVHMFPDADVPVVQLSIDETLSPAEHFDIGRRLRPLRDQGVLIFGSGNVVHNLHAYAWGSHKRGAYDWAERFETVFPVDGFDGGSISMLGLKLG